MAIRFPFNGGECRSMQDVAGNTSAWKQYLKLSPEHRALLQEGLKWEITVDLGKLLIDDAPAAPAVVPNVVAVAAAVRPRARGPAAPRLPARQRFNSGAAFRDWVHAVDAVVRANAGMAFVCGAGSELPGDKMLTISVPIAVTFQGRVIPGSGFVLHYHPGVEKAKVGAAEASRWHLKPSDNAPKHIRATENEIPVTFRSAAKEKARRA